MKPSLSWRRTTIAKRRRSKKRSAANAKRLRPEQTTFFVDRSLGREKVAAALAEAGANVEIHDDHFAADAPDQDWLDMAGDNGWIVVTKDRMIRYRQTELAALEAAGVHAFILSAGSITGDEMAAAFTNALPKMLRIVAENAPPVIGRVTRSGNVSVVVGPGKKKRR